MFSGPHLSHRNLCGSQLWQVPIKPAISGSFHTKCVQADFPFKIIQDDLCKQVHFLQDSLEHRPVFCCSGCNVRQPSRRNSLMDTVQPQHQGGGLPNIPSPPKSSIWEKKWRGGCTPCVLYIHLFSLLVAETSVRLLSLTPSQRFGLEIGVAKHPGSTVYSVEATSFRLTTKMRSVIYRGP